MFFKKILYFKINNSIKFLTSVSVKNQNRKFIWIKHQLCLVQSYIPSIEIKTKTYIQYINRRLIMFSRRKLLLDNKYFKVFPLKGQMIIYPTRCTTWCRYKGCYYFGESTEPNACTHSSESCLCDLFNFWISQTLSSLR